MNTNDYKARSGAPILTGATNALSQVSDNPISNTMRNVGGWAGDIEDAASMGVKLTLSAVGMGRSLQHRGARSDKNVTSNELQAKAGDPTRNSGQQAAFSQQPYSRYDSDKDFYFRCGDYYMPLSIRFTLRAQKNLVESQLIDGPMIIERVSKAPKTIDVTIRLERKTDTSTGYLSSLHVINDSNLYNPVPNISAMVHDLYENQDVFTIENPILNGEHGVTHVIMRDYTITPGEGTTLMTLQMSLTQVDIRANIIDNDYDIGDGSIAPDTFPLA